MQTQTWKMFPRTLEKKINRLLEEAGPSPAKAYQLYKSCKNENLWRNSYEIFALHLQDFFSLAPSERAKSYFDQFLDRPMELRLYEDFSLSFRNAHVNPQSLHDVARWSHEQLKTNCESTGDGTVIADEVLTQTLQHLTQPAPHAKDQNIEFEDFCGAWKKTLFQLFGKKYDSDLENVLKQVRKLYAELKLSEAQTENTERQTVLPSLYLTQTEINWASEVKRACENNSALPFFPLSRGPEKPALMELQKAVELYQLIESKLHRHRPLLDSVKLTILDKCAYLLKGQPQNENKPVKHRLVS